MRIIQRASASITKVLKPLQSKPGEKLRSMIYTNTLAVEEGTLYYSGLTGEMILAEKDENVTDYLLSHRFIVPEDHDDRKLCDELRSLLNIIGQAKTKDIRHYTILTTTDCNARCFYCYELGCEKMTMSEQTARHVANYILTHAPKHHDDDDVFSSGGQEPVETSGSGVKIFWFGGEPLFNAEVIDVICNDLAEADCAYSSMMISNGYLFDSEMIQKAIDLWHLKNIQITLDGTKDIYNQRKAYIYDDPDPFTRVINNIKALSLAGISVSIRLNEDEENHDDLTALITQIDHFSDEIKANITVYTHLLFQEEQRAVNERSCQLHERHYQLEEELIEKGLQSHGNPPKGLRVNGCMADGVNSLVILPDGRFHSCQHFVDNPIWGSIDTGESKRTPCIAKEEDPDGLITPLDYWSEKMPPLPECDDCFFYPQCIRLKNCPHAVQHCSALKRQRFFAILEKQMLNKYNREKNAFTACFACTFVRIRPLYAEMKHFCREYCVDGSIEPAFSIDIEQKDIAFERRKVAESDGINERKAAHYSDTYLETLAVYRKLAEGLIEHDTLLIHGSALMFDETSGFLFAGVSGAGKSTHAKIWRRVFGDRVTMINDDKPLIKFGSSDDDIFVCGTPWDGKHRLSANTKAPLKGICFIKQGENNSIHLPDETTAFTSLYQQTYRPKNAQMMKHILELLNRLNKNIPVYELTCNMTDEAAVLSMRTLCHI